MDAKNANLVLGKGLKYQFWEEISDHKLVDKGQRDKVTKALKAAAQGGIGPLGEVDRMMILAQKDGPQTMLALYHGIEEPMGKIYKAVKADKHWKKAIENYGVLITRVKETVEEAIANRAAREEMLVRDDSLSISEAYDDTVEIDASEDAKIGIVNEMVPRAQQTVRGIIDFVTKSDAAKMPAIIKALVHKASSDPKLSGEARIRVLVPADKRMATIKDRAEQVEMNARAILEGFPGDLSGDLKARADEAIGNVEAALGSMQDLLKRLRKQYQEGADQVLAVAMARGELQQQRQRTPGGPDGTDTRGDEAKARKLQAELDKEQQENKARQEQADAAMARKLEQDQQKARREQEKADQKLAVALAQKELEHQRARHQAQLEARKAQDAAMEMACEEAVACLFEISDDQKSLKVMIAECKDSAAQLGRAQQLFDMVMKANAPEAKKAVAMQKVRATAKTIAEALAQFDVSVASFKDHDVSAWPVSGQAEGRAELGRREALAKALRAEQEAVRKPLAKLQWALDNAVDEAVEDAL